jgi:hypothetical protein
VYLAEKELTKDDTDRQIANAKTDIAILNQEVLKYINALRVKDANIVELTKTHAELTKSHAS